MKELIATMTVTVSPVTASTEAYINSSLAENMTEWDFTEHRPYAASRNRILFHFLLFTVFTGLLCIFGLVGNIVSIVVLHKDRGGRVHAAMFLLQALAIADNCVLIISFICLSIAFGLLRFMNWMEAYEVAMPYITLYATPIAYMAHTSTVWMVVLLAVNRYVAICRPFDAHRFVSVGKTKIQVAVVFLFAFVFNIPRFFQYQITYIGNSTIPHFHETNIGLRSTFGMVYSTVLYTIIVFILPLILLILLNGRLIIELRRMRLRRANVQEDRRSEENITLVMIIIIIVFILCICPERMNHIVIHFRTEVTQASHYFDCAAQVLVVINSSTNFIIYYIFRKRFRQILFQTICLTPFMRCRSQEYIANGLAEHRQAITLLSTADVVVSSSQHNIGNSTHTIL